MHCSCQYLGFRRLELAYPYDRGCRGWCYRDPLGASDCKPNILYHYSIPTYFSKYCNPGVGWMSAKGVKGGGRGS